MKKNKNFEVIEFLLQDAKKRKCKERKKLRRISDGLLCYFFENKLQFTYTPGDSIAYNIDNTEYYLEFKYNYPDGHFFVYITNPVYYKSRIEVVGLDSLSNALLDIEPVIRSKSHS